MRTQMKKVISVVLALCVTLMFIPLVSVSASSKDEINVIINGTTQDFDVSPVNMNGSIFVPMRAIFEKLQSTIKWDGKKQQVTATKGSTVIVLTINSKTATINSKIITLSAEPQAINGITMVPLRFVGEALGAEVKWDPKKNAVMIESSSDVVPPAPALDTDVEGIKSIIQANIDYFNNGDAEGFLSTLDNPKETVPQLETYFKQNRPEIVVDSISDIQVNGDEATAKLIRIETSYENKNTPTEYISFILKSYSTVSLIKRNGDWIILKFKFEKHEQLPIEKSDNNSNPAESSVVQ